MNASRFRRSRGRTRRSWIAICTLLLGCIVASFFAVERLLRLASVSTASTDRLSGGATKPISDAPPSTTTAAPGTHHSEPASTAADATRQSPRLGLTLPKVAAVTLRIESTGQYVAPLMFGSDSPSVQPRMAFVFSTPLSELQALVSPKWSSETRLSTTIQCLHTGTYLSRDLLPTLVDDSVQRRLSDGEPPLLARVSVEKVQARSAERWELIGIHPTIDRASVAPQKRFYLFGVKSSYLPDADRWCLADPRWVAGGDAARRRRFAGPVLYLIDAQRSAGGLSYCAVLIAEAYSQHHNEATNALLATTDDEAATAPTRHSAMRYSDNVRLDVVTTLKLPSGDHSQALRHLAFWRDAVRTLTVEHHIPSVFHICIDGGHEAVEHARNTLGIEAHSSKTAPQVTVHDDCEVHPALRRPTYRGLFRLAQQRLAAEGSQDATVSLVLYINADILMWPAQLSSVLRATSVLLRTNGFGTNVEHILVTGRRRNCAVDAFAQLARAAHDSTPKEDTLCVGPWRAVDEEGEPRPSLETMCPWYEDAAEDYFLLTPQALLWDATTVNGHADLSVPASAYATIQHEFNATRDSVPPMVVGGIAFDNWLVATMATLPRSAVVDATAALDAFHIGGVDDASLSASHRNEASKYNHEVAHYCGGWAHGKVSSHSFTFLPFIRGLRWTSTPPAEVHEERCDRAVFLHQRFAVHCTESHPEDCRLPFAVRRPRGDAFDGPWVWSGG